MVFVHFTPTLLVFEINVDATQINVSTACLIETSCSGFIQLDVARRGGGEGLLEGTDPEPLLTSLVITRQHFCFHINMVLRIKTSESLCNQLLCVC